MSLNLDAIPLVDDHCHALLRDQRFEDLLAWQRYLTESDGPQIERADVRTTASYRRLIARLAAFFQCEATPEAVFAARQQVPSEALITDLFRPTNTELLIVDEGLPSKDISLPNAEFTHLTGVRTASLLRLELLFQELVMRHEHLEEVEAAVREALQDLRARGYVGLKSIVAYRTGLAICPHPPDEVRASFRAARREAAERGTLRIAYKPLLDTLLMVAFEMAAQQELPVQFHTGYGDTDADMLLANPLHLRWLLGNPRFRGMKSVLLHESYPYTRQAGYLAAVYDDVYLDLSYGIPFLSVGEMLQFTRQAFGVAPSSKLLYASDAIWIPELYFMSATDGRHVLGTVLGELVADGDLLAREVETTAEAVLRENALHLYGLDGRVHYREGRYE